MTNLNTTLIDAVSKAVEIEQALSEQLACMVLEREHPLVRVTGTYAWQVTRLKGELIEAQRTTDALRLAVARASAVKGTRHDHI